MAVQQRDLGAIQLSPSDHTRVMQALRLNFVKVIKQLDIKQIRRTKKRPSASDILKLILKLDTIPHETRRSVRLIHDGLQIIEKRPRGIPDAVDDMLRHARSVPAMIRVLKHALLEPIYRNDIALSIGIYTAIYALEDGLLAGIYDSDYEAVFQEAADGAGEEGGGEGDNEDKDPNENIAETDAKGMIAGALVGIPEGPPGMLTGAVVGGAADSLVEAVDEFLDWLL
jgi:hypothetical protein